MRLNPGWIILLFTRFRSLARSLQLFLASVGYLSALFVVPNNKVLLIVSLLFLWILYVIFSNFFDSILYAFILFLPFHNGKTIEFLVLPAYRIYGDKPFYMSVTFSLSVLAAVMLLYIHFRTFKTYSKRRLQVRMQRHDALLVAYVLTSLVTTIVSKMPLLTFLLIMQQLMFVAVYALVQQYQRSQVVLSWLLPIFASLSLFEGAWSCLQFLSGGMLGKSIEGIDPSVTGALAHAAGESAQFFRMQGTFSHPNNLGFFMAITSPILLYYTISRHVTSAQRYMALIGLLGAATGLVLSASRASWIAFGVGVYVAIRIMRHMHDIRVTPLIRRILFLLSAAIVIFSPIYILPRLTHLSQTFGRGGGAEFRVLLLERSIDMVLAHPLGVGLGMFPKVFFEDFGGFTSFPTQPHNLFAQIMVASGIGGAFFFGLFLWQSMKRYFIVLSVLKKNVAEMYIYGVSLAIFIFLSMLYPVLTEQQIMGWFWILLACVIPNATARRKYI